MKNFLLLLGFGFVFVLPLNAGNFFGPAPFRNGSPLVSGVDGSYQATARAENVTGIFRFAYSDGRQTANQQQNNWIFFVNGQIQKGSVAAALNEGSLSGVLDNTAVPTLTTNSNGSIAFPIVLASQQFSSSGSFSGKLNLKSPSGAFNGSGTLTPAPPQVNTYTIVNSNGITRTISITNSSDGRTGEVLFKFRGVRNSLSAPSGQTNTTSVN